MRTHARGLRLPVSSASASTAGWAKSCRRRAGRKRRVTARRRHWCWYSRCTSGSQWLTAFTETLRSAVRMKSATSCSVGTGFSMQRNLHRSPFHCNLFFFHTHLFTTANVRVPVQGSLRCAGWEAAVDGCLQPACVSQQLVQSGRVTSSTELSGGRKLKERSCEGSLRRPRGCHSSGAPRRPE